MMDSGNEFKELVEKIKQIHSTAYDIYSPLVSEICMRDSTEDEIEHLLDHMLDFCGFEDFLKLFKRVCRQYFPKYPQMISEYMNLYRELYDDEEMSSIENN